MNAHRCQLTACCIGVQYLSEQHSRSIVAKWSGVAGGFLGELYAGGEAELGVDVGEVGLHGAR